MQGELKVLPKLRVAVDQILVRADAKRDLVTFPSSLSGTGYITDLQDILIVTRRRGYLRIKKSDLEAMLQELEWIGEEVERRGRD